MKTLLESILLDVSTATGVSVDDMKGKSRIREYVLARQFYCKIAKDSTAYSFRSIGAYINRDHATVIHSVKVVENVREVAKWYGYFFNGGSHPMAKPILKPLEPLKVKSEPLPRQRYNDVPCIGYVAFSGYRCHQV